MNEEEIKQSIRITLVLDQLNSKVDSLGTKIENIKDVFIVQTTSDVSVLKDKVSRLESIVYGTIAVIGVELVGLVFLIFK